MTITVQRANATLAEIIGLHADEDVFVCGTGTSLRGFDWRRLNGRTTIALNDAVNADGFAPTYHLFSDGNLYERYVSWPPETTVVVPSETAHLLDSSAPRVVLWTRKTHKEKTVERAEECDPRWPEPYGKVRFSIPEVRTTGDDLYVMNTVAVAGIQMAFKLGAKNIYLLGCDAYTTDSADYYDGRLGNFGRTDSLPVFDVGGGRKRCAKHFYWDMEMHRLREWLTRAGFFKHGRAVWNCSEWSTISAWPKVSLEDVLKETD